jgi:hypothetical protein
MKSPTMLKGAYRSADVETRLYLFLNFRDLRKDFMEIEQEEDALMIPEMEKPDAIERMVNKIDNLFDFFPLSLRARIKRICCG